MFLIFLLQVVYSTGKSVVAVVIGLLVDQGLLDYDAKVAKYWPEFSKLGKENITVADVMRHESGLDHMDHVFVDDDFKRENIKTNCVGKWIENECPQWPNPVFNAHNGQTNLESSKRAYHSITRGWILNEISRRVDPKGRTIGVILHEEIISTGVHCGVPDEELNRIVPQQAKSTSWVLSQTLLPSFVTHSVIDMTLLDVYKSFTGNFEEMLQPLKCLKGVSTDVSVTHKHWQQDKFRSTEQPSSNFHASAKGLAWVAYIMANQGQDPSGKQILSKETWEKMHHDPKEAHDAVLGNSHAVYLLIYLNMFSVMNLPATFWFQDFAQLLLREDLITIEVIQNQTMLKPIQTSLDGMDGEVMEAQVCDTEA